MRLLDTDTCIEILRGNRAVVAHRAALADEVATTWVTAAELYFGAASSIAPESNAEVVGRFLATLPVLGLDDQAARRFGQTKARLRREGAAVPDADLLIAAVAVAQGAVLVTGNRRHYERIPEVRVEDWIR